jgi:organic hydroperoxide reductase OsmC/OhrA
VQDYPHRYEVAAAAAAEGLVTLSSKGLPDLPSAPPEEFGGPGDHWSPETLLVAAVADCFVLTFRAIARASRLEWTRLHAAASGTLDRAEDGLRFTAVQVTAELAVPGGVDEARARRLLEKAERGCLITRSLTCPSQLVARVQRASD